MPLKRNILSTLAITALGFSLAAKDLTSPSAVVWPGRQPDGSMLLPNMWSLEPAGSQVQLGDFPVNIALHPQGKYAAILHCGYSPHEVVIVDLQSKSVISRSPLAEAFYGITFSPNGKNLYCSGSSGEQLFAFDFDDGKLSAAKPIKLRDPSENGVPAGLAIDSAGKTLFAANVWNDSVSRVNLSDNSVQSIELSTNRFASNVSQKPDQDFDTAAATKRAKAARMDVNPNALSPYACVVDSRRNRLYVSMWGAAQVDVVDLKTGRITDRWPTGQHPCEMTLSRNGRFLFIANANDNTVTVIDTRSGRTVETIWAALFPQAPLGTTPNSLTLSPDGKTLFVANANINAVADFDVQTPGKSRSLGFIPVGWYPTSVRVTPDGRQLLVTNGKGIEAKANPNGPQPVRDGAPHDQYIAKLLRGTLSIIDLPSGDQLKTQMAAWTAQVYKCSPLRADAQVHAARPEGSPVPLRPGDGSPIKHCIYVIKENRTYDQIFGDMPEGNGDTNLCLFPESVTPNHHKLAREFVLLDNFYVESEVSADGHEWSTAAYASDFVEKTWPLNYGHKNSKFAYPAEGIFPIAYPASGYLWDRAHADGVSYRSYGEFVQNAAKQGQPGTTKLKNLKDHFDPGYRSFDLAYSDTNRASRFLAEMKRYEQEGDMPGLQIVRLPNDHTHGVTPGLPTPTRYLADNDTGLGMLVEGVSRSKFWPTTAIFVVEDDAQNGPDHVDAHRTVALVISPYTHRHAVDSTMYSTSSMLRTMELILGMKPMTEFDAAATPMFNSFSVKPDAQVYEAVRPNVDTTATNTAAAWGSNMKFNFAKEDEADDFLLNESIWRSVRGTNHPMPAPVRAGFVMVNSDRDDD